VIDEMEAWHVRAIQVKTSVNPSAKRLHTIILEMDAPLGGMWTQMIWGCGTPRCTIASLIGSHKITCTLQQVWNVSIMADRDLWNGTMSNQNFWQKKFGELPVFLLPNFSSVWCWCQNWLWRSISTWVICMHDKYLAMKTTKQKSVLVS